ncbi:MAG: DUF5615 family PIN-like protein [Bacteroidota bacterium]
MKFIVDAHFPWRLTAWLTNYGEDAIHTSNLPKGNDTSDKEIIQLAEEQSRIVITKDSDFIRYRIIHGTPTEEGYITQRSELYHKCPTIH